VSDLVVVLGSISFVCAIVKLNEAKINCTKTDTSGFVEYTKISREYF
jgi:hypothetical protein